MMSSLKSELRKLLSVRMTYVVTLIGLLITGGLMSFYGIGWNDSVQGAANPQFMETAILSNANFIAVFISVVALLMVTHEYRYNVITYTLTSSNSRSKSFLAKLVVIGGFSVVVTALASVLGPLLALLAMHIKGVELSPQIIPYLDVIWRCLFFGFGMATAAAVIAFIVRNQVGAIMTFFIAINTVEGLLGILLKENTKYLPFTSIQHVVNVTMQDGSTPEGIAGQGYWSPPQAALLFSIYLAIAGIIAWLLFRRRDAN